MKVLTEAEMNAVAGGRRKGQPLTKPGRVYGDVFLRSDDRPTVS